MVVDYFRTRWLHGRQCWKHARRHWAVTVAAFLGAAFIAYVNYGQFLRLPTWAKPESLPKIPIAWAIVVLETALLFLIIEGSYRLHRLNQPEPRNETREKVLTLGHDLFAFLREKGPMPNDPLDHIRDKKAIWREAQEKRGPYVEAIHYGYLNRFKNRCTSLFYELAEKQIPFNVAEYEVNPPQAVRETNVRKIAQECFLVVAHMDIAEESKGT